MRSPLDSDDPERPHDREISDADAPLLPANDAKGATGLSATVRTVLKSTNPALIFRAPTITRPGAAPEEDVQIHTAINRTLVLIQGLRVFGFFIWLSLVVQYFSSVDGHFAEWVCIRPGAPDPLALTYCSNDYEFPFSPGRCVMTESMCHVSLFESVPTLIFLTIMQLNIFTLRVMTSTVAIQALPHIVSCDPATMFFIVLLFSQHLFLFVTFIIEGFALPLGTKDGLFAFQPFTAYGLNITCLVAIPLLFAPLLIRLLPDCMRKREYKLSVESWAFIAYLLAVAAVAIHSLISAIAYAVNHWDFVSASMFFVAWHKSYLSYRVTRTLFSVAAILENVLSFALFNLAKRVGLTPNKVSGSKFGVVLDPFGVLKP